MPMLMVAEEEGQVPQAPWNSRETTPPLTDTTSTFPPSAMRKGRTSFSAWSTVSALSGIWGCGSWLPTCGRHGGSWGGWMREGGWGAHGEEDKGAIFAGALEGGACKEEP